MNKTKLYFIGFLLLATLSYLVYKSNFQTTDIQISYSENTDNTQSLAHEDTILKIENNELDAKTPIKDNPITPTIPVDIEEILKSEIAKDIDTETAQDVPLSNEDALKQFELWKQDAKYVDFDKIDDFDQFLENDAIDPLWSSQTESSFLEATHNSKFANSYPDFQVQSIQCKSKLCKLTFSGVISPDLNFTASLNNATKGEIYRTIYINENDNGEVIHTAFIARGKH